MKSRPILFGAPMVRALLDGSKTQTRRVAKTEIVLGREALFAPRPGNKHAPTFLLPDAKEQALAFYPYGQPGDRLWVREAWSQPTSLDPGPTFYRADYPACVPAQFSNVPPIDSIKWKPSIHMRRDQSRITLEVTGVRVERLQAISEADAMAEGVFAGSWEYDNGEGTETAKESYECLWESINGPGSWAANPWVWVVEFKRVTQ